MKNTLFAFLISLSLFSCSKNDGPDNGGENGSVGYPNDLTGTIYYKWATEGIIKVSFPSATGGSFIEDDTKLNNFDVSRGG